jgi:hypothetical protein
MPAHPPSALNNGYNKNNEAVTKVRIITPAIANLLRK